MTDKEKTILQEIYFDLCDLIDSGQALDTILSDARKALVKRDRLAEQLRQVDQELSGLTQRYRVEAKIWITSPLMLRHAVEARIGKKLAA